MSEETTMDSENALNSNVRMTRSRASLQHQQQKQQQQTSKPLNSSHSNPKSSSSSSSVTTKPYTSSSLSSLSANKLLNKKLNDTEQKIKDKIKQMPAILSQQQLKNLNEHKYSAQGVTLLDPLFQPYWRWLVEQMPLWLAPNALTIIGLIINVVTSTILILYSPNATDHLPSWSLYLCAIGLFVYQSLDAIDGKQARRTNSSSPLGELFDHGCDAVSTVFVILALSVCLRIGQMPWLMFLVNYLALFTFYTAHWQTYVTGTLLFGYIDVTEAQLTIYIIYFLTGLLGDSIWDINVPVVNISLRYFPVVSAAMGSVVSIINNISTISKGGKGKNGSSVANTSIVFPVFPILLFVFLTFSIASKSVTDLYLNNICLYTLTFGLVWVKITIKLIIAHMTKGEIFLLDPCLIGPIVLFLNQYFNYLIPEVYILYLSLIIVTYDVLKYCTKVCYQICTHMNIYLFKITPPEQIAVAKQQDH